ncbi:hypothetical protein DDO73_11945 [Vibrio cholerae]|uniref:hypothetical protein n=1 Tax=Vibrio cholerae TaxID=666 RepID=UPI0006813AD1|nr:hypothetical protein [Vibrio cholerae]EGR4073760.1 hypothetical protein [Vibrio cholerae]
MVITQTLCKMGIPQYSLGQIEDSYFQILDTDIYETPLYSMNKTVLVKLPQEMMPEGIFQPFECSKFDLDNSQVRAHVTITRNEIDIVFYYALYISKNRNEEGQQLIRDTVAKEFSKVDFLTESKAIVTKVLNRAIDGINELELKCFLKFLTQSATSVVDAELEQSGDLEWDLLCKHEQHLNDMLNDLAVYKATLRKNALTKYLEQDERPLTKEMSELVEQSFS